MNRDELIRKYNVPAPRYTSYPTVPYWDISEPQPEKWLQIVKRSFEESGGTKGISIYIHLPFCEKLCTYCACTKKITKNHAVEYPYIQAVLKEWAIYLKTFGKRPVLRELHLGGGTPTFFSPENLEKLIRPILDSAELHPEHEFSFEGHPNNTTRDHLQTLYNLGFRRVSLGVQDLDEEVQQIISRIQPFTTVAEVTAHAREIGYNSVNFDLVYGLPRQTKESVAYTIDKVSELHPERIAFYSYAHVPWLKTGQRKFSDEDLPSNSEKRALYELGKEKLLQLGFADVGMDHFAMPGDGLLVAANEGRLHRNFMGYTTSQTELLLGLGASSISDAKYGFAQNEKSVNIYQGSLMEGELPLVKTHFQTDEDMIIRRAILDVACRGKLLMTDELSGVMPADALQILEVFKNEQIIDWDGKQLTLKPDLGKLFLRNVCMVFDKRLAGKKEANKQQFSQSI